VWHRGPSLAARVLSTFALVLADSFRDAFARTGMNLAQSVVVVALELGRRGWRAARELGIWN